MRAGRAGWGLLRKLMWVSLGMCMVCFGKYGHRWDGLSGLKAAVYPWRLELENSLIANFRFIQTRENIIVASESAKIP